MNSTTTARTARAVKTAAPEKSAAEFAAELRANVDAWYREPNTPETYAAFTAKNGATWRRVREAGDGVEEEVMRILRETR